MAELSAKGMTLAGPTLRLASFSSRNHVPYSITFHFLTMSPDANESQSC